MKRGCTTFEQNSDNGSFKIETGSNIIMCVLPYFMVCACEKRVYTHIKLEATLNENRTECTGPNPMQLGDRHSTNTKQLLILMYYHFLRNGRNLDGCIHLHIHTAI